MLKILGTNCQEKSNDSSSNQLVARETLKVLITSVVIR